MKDKETIAGAIKAPVQILEMYHGDFTGTHMRIILDPEYEREDEEMNCIYCGGTYWHPCTGGCSWIVPYVCSACRDEFYGTGIILQKHIGEIEDTCDICELEAAAKYALGDIALELRGKHLELFSVRVREVMEHAIQA